MPACVIMYVLCAAVLVGIDSSAACRAIAITSPDLLAAEILDFVLPVELTNRQTACALVPAVTGAGGKSQTRDVSDADLNAIALATDDGDIAIINPHKQV